MIPLDLLHRALRDDERTLQALGHRADASELPRPQKVVGIVEERLDLDGAGLRLDLPVDGRGLALARKDGAIGEDQLECGRLAGIAGAAEAPDPVGELEILLLADP